MSSSSIKPAHIIQLNRCLYSMQMNITLEKVFLCKKRLNEADITSHRNSLTGASHAVCVHRNMLADASYQLLRVDTPLEWLLLTSIFILPSPFHEPLIRKGQPCRV
uniref:Uncharacterized protein n=1 Tax=Micrurus corallinus TaxID=54390 RepID=A0A2D4F3I5_MICCO